jgi:hypothetical protein
MSLFTVVGEDDGALPLTQPVANSVAGSPFAVDEDPAVDTPAINADAIWVHTSTPLHIRISAAGDAADTNDMPLPAGLHVLPWHPGDILSMIAPSSGTPTVHVEAARAANQSV